MPQINHSILFDFRLTVGCFFELFVLVLALLSLQWIVFLYRDSKNAYYSWKYKIAQYTFEDWNEARNYKHRLLKNIFLIIFLFSNILICVSLLPQLAIRLFDLGLSRSIQNCTFKSNSWLHEYYRGGRMLWFLESVRLSSLVVETGFFELTLLYLIQIYTTVGQNPINFRPMLKKLSINLILSFFIFALNLDDHTFMFGITLYAVVLPVYACIVIKRARKLSVVLGWRHQDDGYLYSRSNSIMLNEAKMIHRYRQTIFPLYVSLMVVSLGQLAYIVVSVWLDTVIQNPCWFRQIYGFSFTNKTTLLPIGGYEFYWTVFTIVSDGNWLLTGMVFFGTVIVLNLFHFASAYYQNYKLKILLREKQLVKRLIHSYN